ncbi:M48 family metalloprotease [Bdellovibrionota bacterium FG-2]
MELDALDPQIAMRGVAILTAIPVVLFALWADYFGRYLEQLGREGKGAPEGEPEYDKDHELQRVRLTGFCVLLFQFVLFLGTGEVRKVFPVSANLLFLAAVLGQGWIQARLEKRFETKGSQASGALRSARPTLAFGLATKVFMGAAFGAVIYLGVMLLSVRVALGLAVWVQAGREVTLILVILGGIFGIGGGLFVNFALAPFFLRKTLPIKVPSEQGEEAVVSSAVNDTFSKAKLARPELRIFDLDRMDSATALVAGFSWGRWIFRPLLLVSKTLIGVLNGDELRAVIDHEAAHIALRHLRRRLLFSVALILSLAFASIALNLLVFLVTRSGSSFLWGGLIAMGSFFVCFRFLGQKNLQFEQEADRYAVEKLGANSNDLVNALRKLDLLNFQGRHVKTLGRLHMRAKVHPNTEARIVALEQRFGVSSVTLPAAQQDKAA